MTALATSDDVAHALGLADAAALSTSQGLRVSDLLDRVSRQFRFEAQRTFTPGTSTVQLLTTAGCVRLAEPVDSVSDVVLFDDYGDEVTITHELNGQEVLIKYGGGMPLPSGLIVTVTYVHSTAVPNDVVAAVAAIVARHLTVDPLSAAFQATELSTDSYRQRFAAWVSSAELMTEAECAVARSYRDRRASVIVQS